MHKFISTYLKWLAALKFYNVHGQHLVWIKISNLTKKLIQLINSHLIVKFEEIHDSKDSKHGIICFSKMQIRYLKEL